MKLGLTILLALGLSATASAQTLTPEQIKSIVASPERSDADRTNDKRRHPEDILAFLDHLETDRRNSAATRNARLAAVHASLRDAMEKAAVRLALAVAKKIVQREVSMARRSCLLGRPDSAGAVAPAARSCAASFSRAATLSSVSR